MTQLTQVDEALFAQRRGEYDEALYRSRVVLKRQPYSRNAMRAESLALIGLGRYREAEDRLHRILRVHPDDDLSMTNLAALYYNHGHDQRALKWINEARKRQVGRQKPTTRYILGLIQLKAGLWKQGWTNYEFRFAAGEVPKCAPFETLWDGRYLGPDRTLVIWNEQGLGDQVQTVRFLPTIKEKSGARVKLVVHPSLVRLFDGMADEVSSKVQLEEDDLHAPMWSLPRLLELRVEDLDGQPYLRVPESRKERGVRFTVGLCWRGSQDNPELRDRSVSEEDIRRLLGIGGIEFRSLQYGEWDFQPRDFYDTAVIMQECDLVVTVDTSVAHLAGALGVPTWLMLRYQGDFRWLTGRKDSPWYGSMRLYQQYKPGDWDGVLRRIEADLKEKVHAS